MYTEISGTHPRHGSDQYDVGRARVVSYPSVEQRGYGFEGGAAVEVLRFEGAGCSCYQDSEG
ncbi:hypothetical protein HanPSC8_Chr03g0107631 [Helianthus annuus]|nr:hypothetical protein HanPSC8_Chr03g0107631 [Helianthus annuus]